VAAELLAEAPEPLRSTPPAETLPVLRPRRLPVRRGRVAAPVEAPEHARHAGAAAGRPSRLQPVLLVGGVLLAMVAALAAIVLFSG
jgi:hypothetical protein